MWHLEIRHYIYDNWSLTSLNVSMSTWHDMNVGERSLFNSPNLLNSIKEKRSLLQSELLYEYFKDKKQKIWIKGKKKIVSS